MKKVSFYTLGCKLNQSETAVLAEQFTSNGYEIVPFDQAADVCIINTCTVTAKTDYRCRQMVRRAHKISPNARIAVVGCYAQLQPAKISKIEGVDFILGSDRKFELMQLLEDQQSVPEIMRSDNTAFCNPMVGNFWKHTRGFLKIQDGCNNRCSYCTVPLARGNSRSDSLEHISNRAKILAERGHKELVLTGVHIGMYGQDLEPPVDLLDAIKVIEPTKGIQRIRLSSLEPMEINDQLLSWMKRSKKICRHFHVPMQSGDDAVLMRMNRNYKSDTYVKIIEKIKSVFPDCGLGTDVIVGFPGESDKEFQNTRELIERLPFSYLHVFSYSGRPGTSAIKLPDQLDPKIIKKRSEILRKIAKNKKSEFYQSQIGKTNNVLWEEDSGNNTMTGWTDNYIRIGSKLRAKLLNQMSAVKLLHLKNDFVFGEVINPENRSCIS